MGRRNCGSGHAGSCCLGRRLTGRVRPPLPGTGRRRHFHQTEEAQEFVPRIFGSVRRGTRGRPYLHLFGKAGRCRPDQQLGRARQDARNPQWPVQGLPSVMLADKGELNGTKIEVFAEATGMRIENAPARRGDAKGIVERYFRTLQDGFKPYLSGIVEPHMSRKMGGHDYRQDATLTLSEFTKIIIAGVLWHNNFHTLSKYDRSELMPGDIPAVPLMLWNWGLANMTGKLRSISEDVARINLMPHDQATVSDLGICIFGCYYTCTEALKQGWFHRGDGKRPSTLQVAYDPRSADHIYVRPVNDLKTYWICDLADRSRRFRGMTFWDVWLLTKLERKSDANAAMNAIVAKGTLLQQINDIAANAQSLKPTNSGLVKKDLGLQIRSNKQAEKNIERQKTAFRPKEQLNDNPADVVHIHGNSEQDYSYPDMTDLLFGDEENE